MRRKKLAAILAILTITSIIIIDLLLASKVMDLTRTRPSELLKVQDHEFQIPVDPPLYWMPKPNSSTRYNGWSVVIPETTIIINQDGFRDKDYPLSKSDDTFRIIVLGDSFTFGAGVENGEAYPDVIEKILNERKDGWNYEVLNFGVSGYDAIREAEFYKLKGVKYNPDLVIVGFWLNDDHNLSIERELRNKFLKNDSLMKAYGLKNEVELLIALETNIKQEVINQMGFSQYWNETVLEPYKRIDAMKGNARLLLFVLGWQDERQKLALEDVPKYTSFDIFFSKVNTARDEYAVHPQDQHPNVKAHKAYAQELYNYLSSKGMLPNAR